MPFCGPLYVAGNHFHFHGFAPTGNKSKDLAIAIERDLCDQQAPPRFPVSHDAMPCKKSYVGHQRQFSETFWYYANSDEKYELFTNEEQRKAHWAFGRYEDRWLKITTIPLNHPDGCLGYRFDYMGNSVAYCTDNEPLLHTNNNINKFCQNVDWLLLDAQYTKQQLSTGCQTFGHGDAISCVDQAISANSKLCILHHHSPDNDDKKVSEIESEAKEYAYEMAYEGFVEAAKEGQVWIISKE
jgi:ribonuclease BN (tRNA processing enzyme)